MDACVDDLKDVPSVAEYKRAFLACKSAVRVGDGKPLAMLKANYRAPEHTVTAGELAESVNLASFGEANLVYGTYAKALCNHLGRHPKFNVAILVRFSGGQPTAEGDEFIRWTLLPPVVQALEELGWVKPKPERASAR